MALVRSEGIVLKTYALGDTSRIVVVYTRDFGLTRLVAKGARRPHSVLRGVLMAFQPLLIDWSGGGEVKTLVRAEWQGGQPLLGGQALLCGYYLNELMVRLTAREDAHPRLFAAFGEAIAALGRGDSPAVLLRRFELALLLELGYGLGLEQDAGSLEGHMQAEGLGQLYVRLLTANFEEAVAARKDKRSPVFTDER